MCLIIQTEKPSNLKRDLLECAYQSNSDGFGVMFYNGGKIHTHKIVPKTFQDIEKVWDKYRNLEIPMGLHFRFNTNGDTTRAMSHPFQILNKQQHKRDLWVMHNGPQLPAPMIDENKSDTHQFIKWILRPQLANNPDLLYNYEWQEMIVDQIGTEKLVFLDGKTKEFTIINANEGKQVDNIGWLSNTYSISRNNGYNYDVTTNTKVPNKSKMNYNYNSWSTKWDHDDYFDDWQYTQQTPTTPVQKQSTEHDEDYFRLADEHLKGLSIDEIEDITYTNPTGIAEYLHDLLNYKK